MRAKNVFKCTTITYYDGSFYFNGTPGNITSGTKASLIARSVATKQSIV
jgi:hypothetical protein